MVAINHIHTQVLFDGNYELFYGQNEQQILEDIYLIFNHARSFHHSRS